jgi:hypothetical protein
MDTLTDRQLFGLVMMIADIAILVYLFIRAGEIDKHESTSSSRTSVPKNLSRRS